MEAGVRSTRVDYSSVSSSRCRRLPDTVEYYDIIRNENVSCRNYCDIKAAFARIFDEY
jgi:hypothetical protein